MLIARTGEVSKGSVARSADYIINRERGELFEFESGGLGWLASAQQRATAVGRCECYLEGQLFLTMVECPANLELPRSGA